MLAYCDSKHISSFSWSSNNIRSSKKPVACNFRVSGRRISEKGKQIPCQSRLSVQWGEIVKGGRSDRKTCFPFALAAIHFKDSQEIGLWILWEWVASHMLLCRPGRSFSPFFPPTPVFCFVFVPHTSPPFVSTLTHQVSASKLFSWGRGGLPNPRTCSDDTQEGYPLGQGLCCLPRWWVPDTGHRQCLAFFFNFLFCIGVELMNSVV